MDGSGFGHISAQSKIPSSKQRGGNRQIVQIIQLPEGLKNTALKSAKAIRLDGQFTEVKPDGQARISTPQGEVRVQIKGKPLPQTGQKVEIDIPPPRQNPGKATGNKTSNIPERPGNNAQQATIRVQQSTTHTSPPSTQTRPSTPAPTTQGSVPNTTSQPPSQSQTKQPIPTTTQTLSQTTTAAPSSNNYINTQTSPENLVQTNIKALSETLVRSSSDILENLRSQALKIQPTQRPLQSGNLVRAIQVNPGQAQQIAFTSQGNLNVSFQNFQKNIGNLLPLPKSSILNPPISLPKNTALQIPQSQILQTLLPTTQQNIVSAFKTTPGQTGINTTNTAIQTITTEQILTPSRFENIISQIRTGQNTIIPDLTPSKNLISFTPAQNIIAPHIDLSSAGTQKFDAFVIHINKNVRPSILPSGQSAQTSPQIPSLTQFEPSITANRSAPHIPAQITGITDDGLPLITTQWPGQKNPISFILQFRANNLPVGSKITLIPINSSTLSPALKAQQGTTMSLLGRALNLNLSYFNASGWPALEDLYHSLLQISSQSALSLGRALPTPTNAVTLGPAAMMFIAAVKSGDFGGWLGDKKIDALEKNGKGNILKRLASESLRGPSIANEAGPNSEWRPVSIPLFWEGEVHKIMFYTRQENPQEQQESDQEKGQTRFIFDLNLSRMGEIQIDGLLRQNRLDLIIRTQHSFSTSMQETMQRNYNSALTQTDLNGEIHFQGQGQNWVHVFKENQNLGVNV